MQSEGSRPRAVRKWPIYPYLLAVRGPGVICASPFSVCLTVASGGKRWFSGDAMGQGVCICYPPDSRRSNHTFPHFIYFIILYEMLLLMATYFSFSSESKAYLEKMFCYMTEHSKIIVVNNMYSQNSLKSNNGLSRIIYIALNRLYMVGFSRTIAFRRVTKKV